MYAIECLVIVPIDLVIKQLSQIAALALCLQVSTTETSLETFPLLKLLSR